MMNFPGGLQQSSNSLSGGFDAGLGPFMQDEKPDLPPELEKAMGALEGMDGKLGKLSIPLLRLQYACGFKSCFSSGASGNSSSWGSWGGSSSSADSTLKCLEKCEAPMTEFAEACENRLDPLMSRVTQCFMMQEDSGAGAIESCVKNALGDSAIKQVEEQISHDVNSIYSKYRHEVGE
ncbi:unnamed protein product [Amoebophrya sp. A25]|nr:unnamed protein product [Amoebophrya sp. A25]|eukprot:GSA25T00026795001.1